MKKNTLLLLILIVSVFIHLLPGGQMEAFAESAIFSDMAISQAKGVQAKHEISLMKQQGVRGVGIGQKDGQLGILVLLDKQAKESQIPAQIDGVRVIVRKVGRIVAHKMNLGVSAGHDIICSGYCSGGTVGFKVCDNTASGGGWISNNHVVASGCPGLCPNNAPLGTDMFSPGVIDTTPVCTTTGASNVGALKRFVPIVLDNTTSNLVDAAFVQSSDSLVSDNIQGLGLQNNEIADPFLGQVVCKSGRTTGVTCGSVTGLNMTISVDYGDSCGNGKFINQVMYLPSAPYTSMSDSGDSGSPVVDSNNRAVALNFAGGDTGDGYGAPIRTVLEELQVSLCSNIIGALVSPSQGTIGSHFTVTGTAFGTTKSFVYLEYWKNGVLKQAKPKITSWTDTSITGIWNIPIPAGSYKMYVKPKAKGTSAIDAGTFIIKSPTIDDITPNSCAIGTQNTISGKFFSSIKPKVYFQNTTTLKKYSSKVISFAMNPDTGDSSLQYAVPKVMDLYSGNYILVLQNKIGVATSDVCSTSNLTPYQPNGWSDKIVVSKVAGTTTDSSPLYTSDSLYVDWAVLNNGTAGTSGIFYVDLYIDGAKINSWFTNPPLNPDYFVYLSDYSIGPLSAGTHTLRIVTDSTHAISESNESDNEYTKTINVLNSASPNLTPYQPNGWSDKIVVSKVAGTTTDSSPLYTSDSLYVDWAVLNNGAAGTSGIFYVDLYIDGAKINSWFTNPPLNPDYFVYLSDYSIGPLSAGTHTLRIVTDSTHAINESNESDNEFTKTINVLSALQGWTLTVVNDYYLSITELYISPSTSVYWGSNWLSSSIPSGSSGIISNIPPGTYDIRAVVSNGAFTDRMGLYGGAGQNITFRVY